VALPREDPRAPEGGGKGGRSLHDLPRTAAPPDVGLYNQFADAGVTDIVCAPWMLAGGTDSTLDAKLAATEDFATTIIAKM
jgi:hypothetical protein